MNSVSRRFILIRHGETVENATGIVQGHRFGTLNDRGREQARCTGEFLRGQGIEKIVASDLSRAKETAEIIGRILNLPVQLSESLRERALGVLEGTQVAQYHELQTRSSGGPCDFRPQGGESVRDLRNRSEQAWKLVMMPAIGTSHVLFVSHGAFNRTLLDFLLGEPLEGMFVRKQDNTCINEGELRPDGSVVLHKMNWTGHLSDFVDRENG